MSKLKEIKSQIDQLSLEERVELLKYLEIEKTTTWDIAHNLRNLNNREGDIESLEFQNENFKIDSSNWREVEAWVNGFRKKMKISPQGDVREYVNWSQKGEQIFFDYQKFVNYVAESKGCSAHEVECKYLLTVDGLQEKMKGLITGSEKYQQWAISNIKRKDLAGYGKSNFSFCDVDARSNIWLVGGCYAYFSLSRWDYIPTKSLFGFSGRLLKN